MENIQTPLSVAALAGIAGMSARNLARLFRPDAGVTPHEFVERARVDAARNLLKGSTKAMKVIACECGFTSANHMRAVFAKLLQISVAVTRKLPGAGNAPTRAQRCERQVSDAGCPPLQPPHRMVAGDVGRGGLNAI
jgi:AraC-like DNA-binding protein